MLRELGVLKQIFYTPCTRKVGPGFRISARIKRRNLYSKFGFSSVLSIYVLVGFFAFNSFSYAQVCSDRTCPSSHRYDVACHTIVLKPIFLYSFNHEDIYEGELLRVSYQDGRDLSFNPSEFRNFPNKPQIMRGSVADLKPRLAFIPDQKTENGVSHEIYVLADEWECSLYDNKKIQDKLSE